MWMIYSPSCCMKLFPNKDICLQNGLEASTANRKQIYFVNKELIGLCGSSELGEIGGDTLNNKRNMWIDLQAGTLTSKPGAGWPMKMGRWSQMKQEKLGLKRFKHVKAHFNQQSWGCFTNSDWNACVYAIQCHTVPYSPSRGRPSWDDPSAADLVVRRAR